MYKSHTMEVMQSKISMLQAQLSMLSLTIAAMQVQMKEMESKINGPVSPKLDEDIENAQSDLNIDDSDNSGGRNDDSDYDSDTYVPPPCNIKHKVPRIKQMSQSFVIVNTDSADPSDGYNSEYDSDYENDLEEL